jgi:hypothetical protein
MLGPAISLGLWLVSLPTPATEGSLAARSVSETQAVAQDDAGSGEELFDPFVGWGERVQLKVVTPEIVRAAYKYVNLPMGAERVLTINGHRYVFVLEHHYHPPGFVGAPTGWHKGVTVYELR